MLMSFVFVVTRAVVGRGWLAVILTSGVLGVFVLSEGMSRDNMVVAVLFGAAFVIPIVTTLLLFGLFAQAVAFFTNQVLNNAPIIADLSKSPGVVSAGILLVVVGAAVRPVLRLRRPMVVQSDAVRDPAHEL